MIIKIQSISITNNKHKNYEHFHMKLFHTKLLLWSVLSHYGPLSKVTSIAYHAEGIAGGSTGRTD